MPCARPDWAPSAGPCVEHTNTKPRDPILSNHATPTSALQDYEQRRITAQGMGKPDKLAQRREAGLLDARARLARLFDEGSFSEVGLFAFSGGDPAKAPADGKVAGFGRIDGREAAAVSNDFTVMGASSTIVNGRKIGQRRADRRLRHTRPVIRLQTDQRNRPGPLVRNRQLSPTVVQHGRGRLPPRCREGRINRRHDANRQNQCQEANCDHRNEHPQRKNVTLTS